MVEIAQHPFLPLVGGNKKLFAINIRNKITWEETCVNRGPRREQGGALCDSFM
ncbi:hypothetical protein JCM19037_4823 [Geomicrobium sp. JCM 19037]|nr:hypothetical protein JCM19037_4823 [Geomicrobium sp. JCM 19037]